MQGKLNLDDTKPNDKYFVAFSNLFINSPYFKTKIFEFFDCDIKRVFAADKSDLAEFCGKYKNAGTPRNFLNEIKKIDIDKVYDDTIKNSKFITAEDELYPEILKTIEDYPLLLYYKGNFDGINFDRTLAVVGSRNATSSARQNTSNIISGFKDTDVVIVSGLASGIDTVSHISAIENNIKTVAVIGSGFKYVYPSQNKKLYEEIEEKGLILSEYPYNLSPMPVNFPQRNRIVTGLSKGVLIAEAKMKSGAMISAKAALEQGRELMCIPGLITNPNCEGIYHLIKNGAGIVTGTDDILNIMNWDINFTAEHNTVLNGIEKDIFEVISYGEISIEGLQQKFDVGINELMVKLTQMELNGLIVQKNGLYYITGI